MVAIYSSDDPRIILNQMLNSDLDQNTTNGQIYNSAYGIVIAKLKEKYGDMDLMVLWKVPFKQRRKDISKIFRDIFGEKLTNPKYIVIPDEALKEQTPTTSE